MDIVKIKFDAENIVRLYESEPRTGTSSIAEGFGRSHRNLLKTIDNNKKDFEEAGVLFSQKTKLKCELNSHLRTKERKSFVTEYLLNKEQSFLLITYLRNLKNNDKVKEFKKRLVKEFIWMENALARIKLQQKDSDHIAVRVSGKKVRLLETDTIKEYIEYCILQGSENAQRYYGNLTRMMNTNLFIIEGKFNNLREWMDTEQLKVVAVVEKIIDNALNLAMGEKLDYHDVFLYAKKKVIEFAGMYGKTKIISNQPKQIAMF